MSDRDNLAARIAVAMVRRTNMECYPEELAERAYQVADAVLKLSVERELATRLAAKYVMHYNVSDDGVMTACNAHCAPYTRVASEVTCPDCHEFLLVWGDFRAKAPMGVINAATH